MRKLLMVLAVVALAVPTASSAQFTLGARIGYAPAGGDFQKNDKMSDGVKSQIPIQVDGLYRFTPDVAAGLYFSYGFGQLNSDVSSGCDAVGVSCSASVMRLGVEGTYTFNSMSKQFVPWLGVGIGFEWLTFKAAFSGVEASQDTTGFEFLNLQLGGDYKVSDKFAVGPFFQVALAQYSSVEGTSIPEKSMHEWFNVGIRGKFDL